MTITEAMRVGAPLGADGELWVDPDSKNKVVAGTVPEWSKDGAKNGGSAENVTDPASDVAAAMAETEVREVPQSRHPSTTVNYSLP